MSCGEYAGRMESLMKKEIRERRLSTDILVVGGGMAGMFAAIKARLAGFDVILTDKNYVGRSGGTHYAEGDIQFFRPKRGHVLKDWLDKFSRDNEYLNNRDWCATALLESEDRYKDLVEWGVEFYEEEGQIRIDGPHRFSNIPRMVEYISMKNRAFAPTIRSKALKEGVRVYDRLMICELLKQNGAVVGAVGFNTTSSNLYIIKAKAVIIATGAGGTAYKVRAMNTDFWTGDGTCMAYRAGAEISGLEFRQCTGGTAIAQYNERAQYCTGGELEGKIIDIPKKYPHVTIQSGWFWPQVTATNEPVTWWGAGDVHAGKGPLYCDLDHMEEKLVEHHKSYFNRIGAEEPKKVGIDFFDGGKLYYPSSRQELNPPIGGAGIWPVNEYCASNIPGLFSAGAACATMLSGAKYGGMGIGLNGGMCTGTRAAKGAGDYVSQLPDFELDEEMVNRVKETVAAPARRNSGHSPAWLTQVLQHTVVPYYVLIYKHEKRMKNALETVEYLSDEIAPNLMAVDGHDWRQAYETKNMLLNAKLGLSASLYRKESRASHFREDYPERNDDEWLCWVKMKDANGEIEYTKVPVPEDWRPDHSKPMEQIYPLTLPKPIKKDASAEV